MDHGLGLGAGLFNSSVHDHNEIQAVEETPAKDVEQAQNGNSTQETNILDESHRLKALAAGVRDQDELERNIGRQADQLLTEQANERDEKRLEKTRTDKAKLVAQIHKIEERIGQSTGAVTSTRLRAEIANYEAQIKTLDIDLEQIQLRIEERSKNLEQDEVESKAQLGSRRMPNESQRDFLIRTGKITPFSKIASHSLPRDGSTLQGVLLDVEEGADELEEEGTLEESPAEAPLSHRNLLQPGFSNDNGSDTASYPTGTPEHSRKRRRLSGNSTLRVGRKRDQENILPISSRASSQISSEDTGGGTFISDQADDEHATPDSSDQSEYTDCNEDVLDTPAPKRNRNDRKLRREDGGAHQEDLTSLDDGNEKLYQARLQNWITRRSTARRLAKEKKGSVDSSDETPFSGLESESQPLLEGRSQHTEELLEDEWHMPHPTRPDANLEDGFRIPGDIYPSLFDYQKTGVRWLWELFSQQVGGIIGDEMGLGKTIQAIAFLAGLHYSKKLSKPVIVVAPATVMKQWVNEFHTWWPPFRVSILHTSGSGMIDLGRESRREDELASQTFDSSRRKPLSKSMKGAKRIVDRVINEGHVLVTTYSGLQTYAELLIPVNWEYAVLDEGHKIRNPNAAITIYCKELRTANRIILSGTPMQNNLVELWSLFDFVFPMRLGTLANFRQQFEFPIRQGGYANASNLQIQTASRCAETLKDTISPYLLQRFKVDVAADLPKKTEQVLFCKLTKSQREAYENFLASNDMKSILSGKRQILYGIDILRKICNHPNLQDHRTLSIQPDYNYGSGAKSGKMVIVKELLNMWKDGGHKTLLFAQHRIMLDILEKYIKSMEGINYRRMDGNTPINIRQTMVDEFNKNPELHVFLLTTKVGGLGVNLTGADRVIIYDPDWNPSTDIQARERAWRLGQKREVQIYRLMIAGTIEEKIFHRQIFKQFLTNKILKDPKQRQTFQMKDLHDLFTLGGPDEGATETGRLFEGTEVKFSNGRRNSHPAQAGDGMAWGGATPSALSSKDRELREMAGVASVEPFGSGEDQLPSHGDSAENKNSESRIMEGIFARSGVHSALEHDQIINGKKVIAADPKIIEREAKRVASEAAYELKKAGELAKTVPIGTPTWTGQFGTAGRPDGGNPQGFGRGSSRGGPASTSILAGLQNRQAAHGLVNGSGPNTLNSRGPGQGGLRGKNFMTMIRDYLVTHGGKVHTQMLIDHFNRYCNTPERTAEFKEMLKEIATLQKGSRGRGVWILKDEYQSAA